MSAPVAPAPEKQPDDAKEKQPDDAKPIMRHVQTERGTVNPLLARSDTEDSYGTVTSSVLQSAFLKPVTATPRGLLLD